MTRAKSVHHISFLWREYQSSSDALLVCVHTLIPLPNVHFHIYVISKCDVFSVSSFNWTDYLIKRDNPTPILNPTGSTQPPSARFHRFEDSSCETLSVLMTSWGPHCFKGTNAYSGQRQTTSEEKKL